MKRLRRDLAMNTSLIAVAQGGFYRLDLMETNSVDITAQLFALQDKSNKKDTLMDVFFCVDYSQKDDFW